MDRYVRIHHGKCAVLLAVLLFSCRSLPRALCAEHVPHVGDSQTATCQFIDDHFFINRKQTSFFNQKSNTQLY
jgi:hypothetical protein